MLKSIIQIKALILLLASIAVYSNLSATDYYVATSGNDSNNGSAESPWRTLVKACASVPADAGHVIHVGEGTFVEVNYIIVPSGVSIVGAGSAATIIKVNQYYDIEEHLVTCDGFIGWPPAVDKFAMQIKNGNTQVFKGFSMDGQSRTCYGAIYMDYGIDVVFDDLNIQRFKFTGLWVYTSRNCEIKNSYFQDNCFGTVNQDAGNIMFHANTNLLIHDNVILETGVMNGKGGYGIKTYSKLFVNACFWKTWDANWNAVANGTKIYNNTITVPELGTWLAGSNSVPDITIEFNALSGKNCEIYNNTLNNHISLIGVRGTGYDYQSFNVHHNFMNLGDGYRYACEVDAQGMEFHHNYIYGGYYPLAQWGNNSELVNLKIHHNVFDSPHNGQPIIHNESSIWKDFKFYNNTVFDSNGVRKIFNSGSGSFANVNIRNNLFVATSTRSDYFSNVAMPGTIDYNAFENIPSKGSNFLTGDMNMEKSDEKPAPYFALQSTSAAINSGVVIAGITDGSVDAPDRGAFEYGAIPWEVGSTAIPPATVNVTSVTVSPDAVSLSVNNGNQLEATIAPSNATNKMVVWSSNNTSVATVNAAGWVTGVQEGTATITVTTQDGSVTATCEVVITPATGVINIGQTAIMDGQDSGSSTFLNAQQASLSKTATIQSISIYIKAAAGKMYMGIYTDNDGKPGVLVTSTAEFTPVVGWNTINVSTLKVLDAGTYWLSYQPNNDALGQAFNNTSGTTYYAQPRAYGALPNTFPESILASVQSSIYASFKEGGDILAVGESKNTEDLLRIYPMPAHGDFTIELDGFIHPDIVIVDMMGRVVFSAMKISNHKLVVSQSFPKGVFIVFAKDTQKQKYRKMIIE